MAWSPKRAQVILDRAIHKYASESDISDTTLVFLGSMSQEGAADSPAQFRQVLKTAGWSRREISRAVVSVNQGAITTTTNWLNNLWFELKVNYYAAPFPIRVGLFAICLLPFFSPVPAIFLAFILMLRMSEDD